MGLLFPKKVPVSFEIFITSPDYCAIEGLYEYWRAESEGIPEDTKELILDGSLGTGKTLFSNLYMAYRIYCFFLNGDPRPRFQLMVDSPIYVLYFSVSLQQAQRSGFKQLYNIIKNAGWFQKNMPLDESITSSIRFPNSFSIEFASAEGHQIGLNVWGFILDEANFREGLGVGTRAEFEEVTRLYTQLLDRQISRFSDKGRTFSLAILISSASYQSAFVERRKLEVEGREGVKVITSVAYKVKPWAYSKEKFVVFKGTANLEPCIVRSKQHRDFILKQLKLPMELAVRYFDFPPVSLKDAYKVS